MAYDATFTKPMQDTYSPAASAAASLQQVAQNRVGIQAQLAVETNKLNAERNDGGVAGNSGGAMGFLGRTAISMAATAGAAMIGGPAAAAVVGAITAGSDAVSFVASGASQPSGNEYYSLKNSLNSGSERKGLFGASHSDSSASYTDSNGDTYHHGFFQPPKPMLVGGMADNMFAPRRDNSRGDTFEEREIIKRRDTVAGKLVENKNQYDTTQMQIRTHNIGSPDKRVSEGWTPPPPSFGM